MTKMTDDQLLASLDTLERQATGFYGGEIAIEQQTAMDRYLSRPFGNEEEGKSQVMSSDVWDVVEGLTPLVARPFVASDDVVKFNPLGPGDEEAAEQETQYINYKITACNDAFEQLVAWIKTGLLQKNGIVKYWWEKSRRTRIERYYDLPDDMYALLLQEDDVSVIAHTEKQDATGETLHDAVLRISGEHGEPRYQVVPPEEFLISRDASSVNPQKARFVGHRTRLTLSQLREMGYVVDDDINDGGTEDPTMSGQYQARRESDETLQFQSEWGDPSMREVVFRESYVLIDYDGDGIAELRKICRVGREILANEETEEIPFCAWTPYQQPFKFYGKCPADETVEIQEIKTTVLRQTMNNIYTINNNRVYVKTGVNLDDLLDNQIAGVVRIEGDGPARDHVMPAEVTPIGAITMPMIEYFDGAKENRTGFSRYNQGSSDLNNQKTLGEVQIVSEQSGQRADLMTRSLAETGIKRLMLGVHGLCLRHANKAEVLRLRDKWVTVDPRSWKTRYDMTVSVGLGNSDKQTQLQGSQLLIQTQLQYAAIPGAGVVQPDNLYNAGAKLAKALGEKDANLFFSNPQNQPQQPPPDPTQNPEFQIKSKELELKNRELDQKDAELQIKHRDSMVGALKAQHDMSLGWHKTDLEHGMRQAEFGAQQQQAQQQQDQAQAEQDSSDQDEAQEAQAIGEIQQGQQATVEALQQVAQTMVQLQQTLAQMADNASKPVRVKKQPDGSWVKEEA